MADLEQKVSTHYTSANLLQTIKGGLIAAGADPEAPRPEDLKGVDEFHLGGLEATEDNQALMRFVYYGGSTEFFFVVFTIFLIVTAVGLWRNSFMWGCVRVLEGFANTGGRFFACAGSEARLVWPGAGVTPVKATTFGS